MIQKKQSHIIWIIDDNPDILEVTSIVLQEAGYTIDVLDDSAEFLEKIKSSLPDLLLVDLLMSGLTGTDIAKIVKENPRTKHIPIVFMSADINIKEISTEAQVDDFIKKPFDIYELSKMVKKHLKKN